MGKSAKSRGIHWPAGWRKSLWVIPGFALLIKFVIISQLPGHAWLGADGDNYLKGLDFLIQEGFLSKNGILHYWPAGYPLFMFTVGAINYQWVLPITAVLQSLLFALSTAYLCQKLHETRLRRFALPASLALTLSPTLTLNTSAIGYELISASVFILVIALIIDLAQLPKRTILNWRVFLIGILLSFNNFTQPRFLLSSLIIFVLVGLFLYTKKFFLPIVIIGIITSFLLPSILVVRNVLANDFATISTNLGVTMRLGAGDGATGGYVNGFPGVDCPATEGGPIEVDQALVKCTINWYLDNPAEIFRLALNKTIYFWSPWFGPVANGSMARNPWMKMNPFYGLATESQAGFDLVFGPFGKVVSWLWILAYVGSMMFGAVTLWRYGGLERLLSLLLTSLIAASWLISLGTLGDHRQRLPVLSMIIILQVIGVFSLRRRPVTKTASKRRR
jgi:hypothetical protein